MLAVMTGEEDRGTLIHVDPGCGPTTGNKFHTSSTEQKPPAHTYTSYTTTQQLNESGDLASLCVGPFSPATTGKKIGVGCPGGGYGLTEHIRGRTAVILSNAPLGNESPIPWIHSAMSTVVEWRNTNLMIEYIGNVTSYTQRGKMRSFQLIRSSKNRNHHCWYHWAAQFIWNY